MSNHPVFALDWTEYEFGSRPDGTSIHIDLERAEAFREKHSTGSRDQFWRSSGPRLVLVNDTLYNQMIEAGGDTYATPTHWLRTEKFTTEVVV